MIAMHKIQLLLSILLLHVSGMAQRYPSPHFTIEPLANGVFAAIASPGGYAICNAGIVDLGHSTLVFDPFMTPEAALDLKKAAEELTGHPVKYVVNSHYHNDHTGGNEVFTDAVIISTARTRELMRSELPKELEENKTLAPERLQGLLKGTDEGLTTFEKAEKKMWRGYYEALVSSLPGLTLTYPNLAVDDGFTIYGDSLAIEFHTFGTGHTGSDLVMYLPKKRVAFLGDLLFIKHHPWLGDGDIQSWTNSLDSVAKLNASILVPGHGPVGSVDDMAMMKTYFGLVREAAALCRQKGKLPKDSELKPPPVCANWHLGLFYKQNVMKAYDLMYNR